MAKNAVKRKQLNKREQDLTRRYLIWCYKTTKEEIDRIDRYFTQLAVDAFVLRQLKNAPNYRDRSNIAYKSRVDQFERYMQHKKANVLKKKFKDARLKVLNPDYQYLSRRLAAIEMAIKKFLGKRALSAICRLYEEEMTSRILSARDHA